MVRNLASLFQSLGIDDDDVKSADASAEEPADSAHGSAADGPIGGDNAAWSDAGTPTSAPADAAPAFAPQMSAPDGEGLGVQKAGSDMHAVDEPPAPHSAKGSGRSPSASQPATASKPITVITAAPTPDPYAPDATPATPEEEPLPVLPQQRIVKLSMTNLAGHTLLPLVYSVDAPREYGQLTVRVGDSVVSMASALWFDSETQVLRDDNGVGGKLTKGFERDLASLQELAERNGVSTNFALVVDKYMREERRMAELSQRWERNRSRVTAAKRRGGRTPASASGASASGCSTSSPPRSITASCPTPTNKGHTLPLLNTQDDASPSPPPPRTHVDPAHRSASASPCGAKPTGRKVQTSSRQRAAPVGDVSKKYRTKPASKSKSRPASEGMPAAHNAGVF